MSAELNNQLADLIERSKQTDRRIEQIGADAARRTVEVATVKVELSDEQMDVLLRDIGDLIGKVDALEQRISDVNDAALYDRSQLEERIDALEQRVERLERKLNHKSIEIADESLKIGDGE